MLGFIITICVGLAIGIPLLVVHYKKKKKQLENKDNLERKE